MCTNTESSTVTVGHCKKDDCDVYIGRGRGNAHIENTRIGKRGWLGNPFSLECGFSREESISRFAEVILRRVEQDPEFRKALYELKGATLGCWCRSCSEDDPACHGDVVKKVIEGIEKVE